jgi:hypothetical protein
MSREFAKPVSARPKWSVKFSSNLTRWVNQLHGMIIDEIALTRGATLATEPSAGALLFVLTCGSICRDVTDRDGEPHKTARPSTS